MKYLHREAFCLMAYRDQVTGEHETIWNSRDGVTPFMESSRAGNRSQHVDWQLDRCVPGHLPQLGDRVFIDLTLERAIEFRTRFVEKHWDREIGGCRMPDQFVSKEEAVRKLAQGDVEWGGGGAPDLITVDQAFLDQLTAERSRKRALIDAALLPSRSTPLNPSSLLHQPSAATPPMSAARALLELASAPFDELREQVVGTPLEGFLRKVRAVVKAGQPEAAVVGLDMLLGGAE